MVMQFLPQRQSQLGKLLLGGINQGFDMAFSASRNRRQEQAHRHNMEVLGIKKSMLKESQATHKELLMGELDTMMKSNERIGFQNQLLQEELKTTPLVRQARGGGGNRKPITFDKMVDSMEMSAFEASDREGMIDMLTNRELKKLSGQDVIMKFGTVEKARSQFKDYFSKVVDQYIEGKKLRDSINFRPGAGNMFQTPLQFGEDRGEEMQFELPPREGGEKKEEKSSPVVDKIEQTASNLMKNMEELFLKKEDEKDAGLAIGQSLSDIVDAPSKLIRSAAERRGKPSKPWSQQKDDRMTQHIADVLTEKYIRTGSEAKKKALNVRGDATHQPMALTTQVLDLIFGGKMPSVTEKKLIRASVMDVTGTIVDLLAQENRKPSFPEEIENMKILNKKTDKLMSAKEELEALSVKDYLDLPTDKLPSTMSLLKRLREQGIIPKDYTWKQFKKDFKEALKEEDKRLLKAYHGEGPEKAPSFYTAEEDEYPYWRQP